MDKSKSRSRKTKSKSQSRKNKSKSKTKSYRPTINRKLIELKTKNVEKIESCKLEPLEIKIGNHCFSYLDKKTENYLLNQLSANKHLHMSKIITPKQYSSNCWFNVLFVLLFISDKGRQFFHYFRNLMILGEIINGDKIPDKLRSGFALLNYNIEACLTGNKYAMNKMNTNRIIQFIYKNLPKQQNIYKVGNAGNPFTYYNALVQYLSFQSIRMVKMNIQDSLKLNFSSFDLPPHVILLQYSIDSYLYPHTKVLNFNIGEYMYSLDSVAIIDNDRNHFCGLLMCNGEEYGYDGMSHSRLVKLNWKSLLNVSKNFSFKGSKDIDNKTIQWNFMKGYQMLVYYRKK
jgi:hypothetical protein